MRLPFVRSRQETDPSPAEALRRIEDRLDRLIVIGERTNKLLERVEASGAASAGKTDELDHPERDRVPALLARPVKLHEAIIQVLLDAGEPLIASDIAARIRARDLYQPPRSGHELRGGQVSARVGNATYRDRFVRREGRIWLADADAERLRLTSLSQQ